MDFCIAYWDPDHQGVLMEPHHNTYDIEFWGPDGMCTSFYLGALAAMARWPRTAGHPEEAAVYQRAGAEGRALPGRAPVQRRVLRAESDAHGAARFAHRRSARRACARKTRRNTRC